jgi:hypothetical protein
MNTEDSIYKAIADNSEQEFIIVLKNGVKVSAYFEAILYADETDSEENEYFFRIREVLTDFHGELGPRMTIYISETNPPQEIRAATGEVVWKLN